MKLFRNATDSAAAEKTNNDNNEKVKPSPVPRKRGPGFLFSFQIFTLMVVAAVLVGSTLAWYINNRATDNQILSVKSDSADEAIIGCHFIQSTWNAETENETFSVVSTADAVNFALNPYDAIFKTNYHTPAFIRIRLQAGSSSTMQVGTTVNITLSCSEADTSSLVNQLLADDNPNTDDKWNMVLSNVIHISAATNGSLMGEENAATLYNTLADNTAWTGDAQFVSWTDQDDLSTYGKERVSPVIQLPLAANAINSDGIAEIFVRIDYDDDLIDAFLKSIGLSNEIRRLDDPVEAEVAADLTELHILTGS